MHEMHADFVGAFARGMLTPNISPVWIRLQSGSLVSFSCLGSVTV